MLYLLGKSLRYWIDFPLVFLALGLPKATIASTKVCGDTAEKKQHLLKAKDDVFG